MRVREVLQLRESTDPKVSGAGVAVKTGRRWRAEAAVARGRAGLGTSAPPHFDKAQGKERKQLVQN